MIARWLLAVLISSGLSAWWAYSAGVEHGKQASENQCNTETVQRLSALTGNYQTLISEANKAVLTLAQQTAVRQRNDDKTTKEMRDALQKTASVRTGCLFDDRVMQQLSEARERAAQATAYGFPDALPTAHSSTSQ